MFKNHFAQTVATVMALVMGLIMAVVSCLLNGVALNFANLYRFWGIITLTVLLTSIFIPYTAWSKRLMGRLGMREGTLAYKLLNTVIPTLVLNTILTVVLSCISIIFNETIPAAERAGIWVKAMLHDWPITFVISYFAAMAAEICGIWVAKRYIH